MIIDDEVQAEARSRAIALLSDCLTEDQRWTMLEGLLKQRRAEERERAIEHLVPHFLLVELFGQPLHHGEIRQLGLGDALSGKITPENFIHRVRLAKAAGSGMGKL